MTDWGTFLSIIGQLVITFIVAIGIFAVALAAYQTFKGNKGD